MTPSECLYIRTNFDLVGIDIPAGFRRTTLPAAMARIATSRARVLELPEPLWARFLPRAVCLAAAWSLSGLMRGRWRRARTYAMENNDPLTALLGDRRLPKVVATLLKFAVGALICLMYERVAFASEASAATYLSLPFVRRLQRRVFFELPARPSGVPATAALPGSAVFVGVLAPRKGLQVLQLAWELVEVRSTGTQLHIVGTGPLEADVDRWVRDRPEGRVLHGQLPNQKVLELLPTFSVLVAPSIRWGRWREQIGLPITEALESGLTVVTSTETALAPWLEAHHHHVVPTPVTPDSLAAALLRALRAPLPREQVLETLPIVSPRMQADRWLHS